MRDRCNRATIAMKKTWSIGERLFRDDFRRRKKMFDALVGSVTLYSAEIWGWKNEARLDRVNEKIRQVDLRIRLENTELHLNRRNEND